LKQIKNATNLNILIFTIIKMPKIRKRTSKRVGFREKYKVQKKVQAHHKKIAKKAK